MRKSPCWQKYGNVRNILQGGRDGQNTPKGSQKQAQRGSLHRSQQLGRQAVESTPCLPDLHRQREDDEEAAGLPGQTPVCA